MADQLQLRGGTTLENSTFTGAPREVTVDTNTNTLVVHNGITPGGVRLAREEDLIDEGNLVHKTGDETIDGTKAFNNIIDGSISGNAVTSTTLQTARTINGVSFDGSIDITVEDDTKASLDSPAFINTPTAPTASVGTNTTQLATTAFVLANASTSSDVYTGSYGVTWHSDVDRFVRIGASGYTSIQSQMKRCLFKTDGTVNYFLHPQNSNYKLDGTTAVLSGADGNVMVQIPKYYVKYSDNGIIKSAEISLTSDVGFVVHPAFIKAGVEVPYRYYRAYTGVTQSSVLRSLSGTAVTRTQTIATFRTQARANGSGWEMVDWNLLNAVQTLGLVEFADFQWTRYIGTGNDTGTDYGMTTGQSNGVGNASSPSTNNNTWMSYRGIENFYADTWEFIDGININNYVPYVNSNHTTFASDVFTGDYISTSVTMPVASSSYIRNITFDTTGFIPTSVTGGSSTTYIGDGLWTATGARIALFGGSANYGAIDGPFCLYAYDASSHSNVGIGAGVSY